MGVVGTLIIDSIHFVGAVSVPHGIGDSFIGAASVPCGIEMILFGTDENNVPWAN
jgi:hypothetical protein